MSIEGENESFETCEKNFVRTEQHLVDASSRIIIWDSNSSTFNYNLTNILIIFVLFPKVHRNRVGVLNANRISFVPTGDRDSLLGKVLRPLAGGSVVGLHRFNSCFDNFLR